jgi:hypothetical protein
MEVLVVIVILLVGILAVVQIFPKGFQILMVSRNNSVSSALARTESERLKSAPEQLPMSILPVVLQDGVYITDPTFDPNGTNSMGDRLLPNGVLQRDGVALGNWQLFSGPNAVKRVVGESRRVPAPRSVGSSSVFYGGLLVLQFGPIDYNPGNSDYPSNLSVYGNDLVPQFRSPDPNERYYDGQYYVSAADSNAVTLGLPSGPEQRQYRVAFSAYINQGGTILKRDYIDVDRVNVPAAAPDAFTGKYPLYAVSLQSLIPDSLVSVDPNTLAVQRAYKQIASNFGFSNDPYEFKLLDTNIGVLLFNPLANSTYINKPGGREPLLARVNYDVYDWRILKDDFRLGLNSGAQQHKLSVGSLKVAGNTGIDGLKETNIPILESAPTQSGYSNTSSADEARANNLVIVDMTTGGVVMERLPGDAAPPQPVTNPLVTVNKSTGVITFIDSNGNPADGTQGRILLPDGTVLTATLENRALRAMYRVRNEFSVQVLKASSRYTSSPTAPPGASQFYVGGTDGVGNVTRIYFPRMDAGRKVNLSEVNYFAGGQARQISGQDMIIRYQPNDVLGLPSVDIAEIDGAASGFNYASGAAVRGVKGASVAVRVLWNPDSFFLSQDPIENMARLEKWGQGYRRSTNETFLERAEVVR